MKSFLQNLLIFLSLCLCGLSAYQWHVEKNLRQDIQSLHDTVHDKLENLQSQQQAIKHNEEEIKRLDGLKNELLEIVKSNRTEIAKLNKDLDKSDQEMAKAQQQAELYKDRLTQANEAIKQQNENVAKQNEVVEKQNGVIKKLSADYAETAGKYNKLVADFNELVEKWNAAQAAAAAAATNAANKK